MVQELVKKQQCVSTNNTSGSGGSNNSHSGFSNMFSTVGKKPSETDENQRKKNDANQNQEAIPQPNNEEKII